MSKDYKYKKFKKIRRNTRKVKQNQKIVEPNIIEIIEPKVEYSRAKYISNNQEDTAVKMLDEIVYIDDETDKSDNKTLGLIPLDEN